jgi:hypothetical protein
MKRSVAVLSRLAVRAPVSSAKRSGTPAAAPGPESLKAMM